MVTRTTHGEFYGIQSPSVLNMKCDYIFSLSANAEPEPLWLLYKMVREHSTTYQTLEITVCREYFSERLLFRSRLECKINGQTSLDGHINLPPHRALRCTNGCSHNLIIVRPNFRHIMGLWHKDGDALNLHSRSDFRQRVYTVVTLMLKTADVMLFGWISSATEDAENAENEKCRKGKCKKATRAEIEHCLSVLLPEPLVDCDHIVQQKVPEYRPVSWLDPHTEADPDRNIPWSKILREWGM